MAKKIGKCIGVLVSIAVLAALLLMLTVLRAAQEQQRLWDLTVAQAAQITGTADPALGLPTVTVQGSPLAPVSVQRTLSLADRLPDNLFYRLATQWKPGYTDWSGSWGEQPPTALTVEGLTWGLEIPAGCDAVLTVQDADGTTVQDGPVQGSYQRTFTSAGADTCQLVLHYATSDAENTCTYNWTILPQIQLSVTLLEDTPQQGEIVPVLVQGNLLEEPMSLETELGLCDFIPMGVPGSYAAFVPVAYNRAPGSWDITVTLGEQQYPLTINVQPREFTVQYMTIDQEIADATWNSATASAEYRATIYPLYEVTDREKYWQGQFIEPVSGYRVTTEYGLTRYTNGVLSERHSGVDLACPLGTPVYAPQGGEVLFAGYLQLSGNTVVLAHGGGMKSMFFHMDSLHVETGQILAQGDKIGEVGTTGYSTGPHLHYEIKIGSQSIDPFALLDGTSPLYKAEEEVAASAAP